MKLNLLNQIGLAGLLVAMAVGVALNFMSFKGELYDESIFVALPIVVANIGFALAFIFGGYLWWYFFGDVKREYNLIILSIYASSIFVGGFWAYHIFKATESGDGNI